MIPVYQYPNQQGLTVTSVQQHVHLDSLVGLSTELAVVPTELNASHNGETFARKTEATLCDYKGALEFSSTNGHAQSEAFPSLERGGENEDLRLSFYTTSKILYQTYKV